MIAFVTALKEEREAVRRAWALTPAGRMRGLELLAAPGCIHLCSGMGAERVQQAVSLAAEAFRPKLFILIGFSVGLRADCMVGNLICDERSSPEALEGLAELPFGRVATCGFLYTAGQKQAFAEKHPESPVADLETEAFLDAVPDGALSLVVRAVSDEVSTDLPLKFGELADDRGFPDIKAIGFRLATRPYLLPRLLRLGRDSAKAVDSMASMLTRHEDFLKALGGA